MAGKSTFLRQNALIAVLAQMGSYVPAASGQIGIVSQIFSRVGASDDLARGRSTFMVEMVETAAILNQADDRALVILDEIGRGTATYDGLSIAWATLEHLHGCEPMPRDVSRRITTTMAALASKLDGVENATVTVKEWDGDVIFLHEVRKGRRTGAMACRWRGWPGCRRWWSTGPRWCWRRWKRASGKGAGRQALIDDLPLFRVAPAGPRRRRSRPRRSRIGCASVLPDELTAKEALGLIYELKGLCGTWPGVASGTVRRFISV